MTLVSRWKLYLARRAAKKYKLDFEHKCCFYEQICHIGEGIKYGTGEIARIPMQSGKIALYKVTATRLDNIFQDTGQRNWYFEFQGYE